MNKSKEQIKSLEVPNNIKYMNQILPKHCWITQKQFNFIWYNNITNYTDNKIIVHENFTIEIYYDDISYDNIINQTITVFISHLNKLVRYTDCPTIDLKNFHLKFDKNINDQLTELLRYIQLVNVCKKCFLFYNKKMENNICDECINRELIKTNKICSICNLDIFDDQICKLKCNHYFHLNCISTGITYCSYYNYYIKCPKCDINCCFVYTKNKQFKIDFRIDFYINTNDIENTKNEITLCYPDQRNLPDSILICKNQEE